MLFDETISVRADEAFDVATVEAYLRKHVQEVDEEPLVVRQFPAGASNLTYLLQMGAWEGGVAPSATGPGGSQSP